MNFYPNCHSCKRSVIPAKAGAGISFKQNRYKHLILLLDTINKHDIIY
ncbi:MAG: hypothetical protein OXJ52_06425 [Oligoflexia bacterium]|nr:hypothetical protein [Oligoflexia bacterium]